MTRENFAMLFKMWLDSYDVPHTVLDNPACQAAMKDKDEVDTLKYTSGYYPQLKTSQARLELMQLMRQKRVPIGLSGTLR